MTSTITKPPGLAEDTHRDVCVGRQSQRDVGQRWRGVKGKRTWCPIPSQRLMQRTQLLPNEKTRERRESQRTNNKTYISGCTLQTPELWEKKLFYLRKESQTRRLGKTWSFKSIHLWKSLLSFIFDGESSLDCLYLGMEGHHLKKTTVSAAMFRKWATQL